MTVDQVKAEYWRGRMDRATNRDDFLHAWDRWWLHAIGPFAAHSTASTNHHKETQ